MGQTRQLQVFSFVSNLISSTHSCFGDAIHFFLLLWPSSSKGKRWSCIVWMFKCHGILRLTRGSWQGFWRYFIHRPSYTENIVGLWSNRWGRSDPKGGTWSSTGFYLCSRSWFSPDCFTTHYLSKLSSCFSRSIVLLVLCACRANQAFRCSHTK